jgi:hypothetical protein
LGSCSDKPVVEAITIQVAEPAGGPTELIAVAERSAKASETGCDLLVHLNGPVGVEKKYDCSSGLQSIFVPGVMPDGDIC